MATNKEVQQAVLDAMVANLNDSPQNSTHVLKLAEAWAWLSVPHQPHGGGTDT